MIHFVVLTTGLLLSSLSFAQLNSELHFTGQNADVLVSEKVVTVVTPEQVQVPDTCTRQVPNGSARVCRDVTRYREECRTIPSSQECGYEQERVCKPVSRSRQVCTGGGTRQECTTSPRRQVCYERPTREVCRIDSSGQNRCTTVGGGQNCQDVGGETSCRDIQLPQNCRTEYYSETECGYESQYRCHTVPSRRECNDIPYSESVCANETQYRTESYACTRTVTRNKEEKKTVKTETSVQINTNGLTEEFKALVSLQEGDPKFQAFSIGIKLVQEPSVLVVLKAKEARVVSSTAKEILVKASLVLEVLTPEMLPSSLPTAISSAVISEGKELVVAFDGGVPQKGSLSLKLEHKVLFGRKVDAELQTEIPSVLVRAGEVEGRKALSIDLRGAMKDKPVKKMKLRLELKGESSLEGELLNAVKPESTRLFEDFEVILQK